MHELIKKLMYGTPANSNKFLYTCTSHFCVQGLKKIFTVYTRVQVERVYKSNPIFEAKNTTFLEKV